MLTAAPSCVQAGLLCCGMQDLSREQAETHKVLVQPALEAAATATVNILQQLIRSTTEQVLASHNLPLHNGSPWTQYCVLPMKAQPCSGAYGPHQLYTISSSM